MSLFLFILLNATLFIRPADLFEELNGVQVYLIVLLVTFLGSLAPLIRLLTDPRRLKSPVLLCVYGTLVMIVLSDVWQGDLYFARVMASDYLRNILYLLLMFAVVDTPARLRTFVTWFILCIVALTAIALLNYYDIVPIGSIKLLTRRESEEDEVGFVQLMATGMFNDPNDFCTILTTGIFLCLSRFADKAAGFSRFLMLGLAGFFFYAIILTKSRGGFLGLLAGLMTLFVLRYGWKKAVMLGMVALPVLVLAVGGRSTQLGAVGDVNDTAHQRMEFWAQGFSMLARSPVFGIGAGQFVERVGMVAHNSYVHSSTELGLPGGLCFLGMYFLPFWSLTRLRPPRVEVADPRLRILVPYLAAILAGNMGSLVSITRNLALTSCIVPGLVATYLLMVPLVPESERPGFGGREFRNLTIAYFTLLSATYLLVRFQVG